MGPFRRSGPTLLSDTLSWHTHTWSTRNGKEHRSFLKYDQYQVWWCLLKSLVYPMQFFSSLAEFQPVLRTNELDFPWNEELLQRKGISSSLPHPISPPSFFSPPRPVRHRLVQWKETRTDSVQKVCGGTWQSFCSLIKFWLFTKL